MTRSRPMTDLYLAAVDQAIAHPGRWVTVPRKFDSRFNADMTGRCLEDGYLRVRARQDDRPVLVSGKQCIRTAAAVDTRIEEIDDEWRLLIRFAG